MEWEKREKAYKFLKLYAKFNLNTLYPPQKEEIRQHFPFVAPSQEETYATLVLLNKLSFGLKNNQVDFDLRPKISIFLQ